MISVEDRDRALKTLRGMFANRPDLRIIIIFEETGDLSVAADMDVLECMAILKHMVGSEPIGVTRVEHDDDKPN